MRLAKWLVLALLILLPVECFALAFPSAVGLGKDSVGGRGGTVIKVTNLNDSGAGSLREALLASGPRVIVFTVSGNIDLQSILTVRNPYVTIAGQTSPGGISVSGNQFNVGTHDVIIRHMRFRAGGHRYAGNNSDGDSFSLWGAGWSGGSYPVYNVILDHCSMTWGVDESLSVTGGAANVTIQHTLVGQGLRYAKAGPTEDHSKGLMISGKVNPGQPGQNTSVSLYRNYIAHNTDRNPMMYNPVADNSDMVVDGVNNVIYNWKGGITPDAAGDSRINWIANYAKEGPYSNRANFFMQGEALPSPAEQNIFVQGNIGTGRAAADPEWKVSVGYTTTPLSNAYQRLARWPVTEALTAETMTAELASQIVASAGATIPLRDTVDAEIVDSYEAGTSKLKDTVSYPADWPTYAQTAAPTDTDGDGMPDTWETGKGLNPSVANASAYTLSADYTDVEVYLNELAGDANTYYVSTTGSDSNSGTSPSTPWQTIAKVNGFNFAAGDVVRFASGDYGTTTLTPTTDHVTFTSYAGAATKPILRGGVNMDGRSYVTIDGLDVTSTGITFSLAGATYNTIRNSTIYSTASSWSPTISVRNGSHFNKITGNTISQAPANNDIINLRNDADNNLIENNDITIQGSHAAIDIEGWTLGGAAAVADRSGNNNIIRNNRITGHNGGGVHITIQANSFNNVIDGNVLKGDATVGNFCGLTYPATQYARSLALIKGVGEHNIIRNNVLSNYPCQDSEGLFFDTYIYDGFSNNALYNHIYHNVVTGIGSGATGLYFGVADDGTTHGNNQVKNNIFVNNGGALWVRDTEGPVLDGGNPATGTVLFQMTDSLDSNYYDKNIFFTSATSGAVIWLGSNYYTVAQADASAEWGVNIQADPNLDANFLPQTGSPALGAGSDLTTITSASGSGTSFDVSDAWYFTDGNGITGGDVIEVNGQTATITDITYGTGQTGTLTVTPAVTWTQGMGVNLPFEGSAPPIGLSSATTGEVGGGIITPTTATRRIRGHFRAQLR